MVENVSHLHWEGMLLTGSASQPEGVVLGEELIYCHIVGTVAGKGEAQHFRSSWGSLYF